jgi:hypothetical protein
VHEPPDDQDSLQNTPISDVRPLFAFWKAGHAEPDLGTQHVRDEVAAARNGRQPRDRLVHGSEQLRHAAL